MPNMRYEFIEQRKFITPTTLLLLIFADKNRNNNISIDCSHIDSNIHRIFLFLFLSLSLSPSLSFSLSKHVSYPATGVWAFKGAGVAFFFFLPLYKIATRTGNGEIVKIVFIATNSTGPPCLSGPCRNGGTCNEDIKGDFSCACKPGFTGVHCESQLGVRLCEQSPCRNDGVCLAVTETEYKCDCQPGWSGKNCETNINECSPNPCRHGGVCIDGINNYTCICDRTG